MKTVKMVLEADGKEFSISIEHIDEERCNYRINTEERGWIHGLNKSEVHAVLQAGRQAIEFLETCGIKNTQPRHDFVLGLLVALSQQKTVA